MSTSRRARSALILCVLAIAIAAITWRLLAPPTPQSVSIEPVREALAPRADAAVELQAAESTPPGARDDARAGTASSAPVAPESTSGSERVAFLLYGFVRSGDGNAAPDSESAVVLTNQAGETRRTPVASDGAYSFADVAPGPHWLRTGSSSGLEARASVTITGDLQVDLQLVASSQVRVRALDSSGAPLKEGPFALFAIATLQPPGSWFDEVQGSLNNPFGVGSFQNDPFTGGTSPDGSIGSVVLRVSPPVHVSLVHNQFVVATQRVEPGQDEVTFVVDRDAPALRKMTLRFRFVDAQSGAPVSDAFAMLGSASSTRTGGKPSADGQYAITGLSPGHYVIQTHAKGFGNPARRVRVEPGIDLDVGDIGLEPAVSIAGRIVDPDGNGVVTNIRYDACDADGKPLPTLGAIHMTKSQSDGSFSLPTLTRGRWALSVSGEPWGAWRRTIDARAGPVEGVEARLQRAVPLVVSGVGESWVQVRFDVVDAEGNSVLSSRLWQAEPTPLRLSPGSYEVVVRATPDAEPRRIPIKIVSDPVYLTLP